MAGLQIIDDKADYRFFLLISYNIIEDSFGKIHWINVSASICVYYWLVDKHLQVALTLHGFTLHVPHFTRGL